MLFLGTYTYARWTGYWNTDLPSRVYFELIPHADSSLRRQRKTKMLKIDEKNKQTRSGHARSDATACLAGLYPRRWL